MKILRELVQIIGRGKLTPMDFFTTNKAENKSKAAIFYEGLVEDKFSTDQEAASFLYDCDSNNSNYKVLKFNLKNKLINALFFLDLKRPGFNKYEQSYFYCCKYMAAAKILIRLQAKEAGINLCHKVFKKAHKNEFTQFVYESAKFLRGYYGTRKGDLKSFEYYNDELKQAEYDWILENRAQEYYHRLMLPYTTEKGSKEKTYELAKQYSEELKPGLKNSNSAHFHFLARYIEVIVHMSINDYEASIKACNDAIIFFEKKPYVYKTAMNVFLHNKLACHTQLKQYEEGMAIQEKTLKLLQAGTYNWFRDRELFFILAMHTQNYQEAYNIYISSVEHKRFIFLSQPIKETWLIYEAYLHFLVNLDEITPEENDNRFNVFRLGKFLNSIPLFSKDKRGLNIPILVIQILFTIIRKDYSQSIDRIEAIEKYCVRYLKKSQHFRSSVFINMLLLIPKCSFHKAAVERKGKKHLNQLYSTPLDIANQTHEIEIIPYEKLWEIILKSLEPKFFRTRSRNNEASR